MLRSRFAGPLGVENLTACARRHRFGAALSALSCVCSFVVSLHSLYPFWLDRRPHSLAQYAFSGMDLPRIFGPFLLRLRLERPIVAV